MKKEKVILIPVGEQIQPLIYGLQNYMSFINTIVLIYTDKTKKQCKYIERSLKKIFFGKIFSVKCDAKNLASIMNELIKFFDNNFDLKNLEIISNITGGTKMMALACYIFSSIFKGNTFYVFKKNGEMELIEVPTLRIEIMEEIKPESKRFKILEILENEKLNLTKISKLLKIKESSTSYYLKDMSKRGLIKRVGNYYEITEMGKLIKYLIKISFK